MTVPDVGRVNYQNEIALSILLNNFYETWNNVTKVSCRNKHVCIWILYSENSSKLLQNIPISYWNYMLIHALLYLKIGKWKLTLKFNLHFFVIFIEYRGKRADEPLEGWRTSSPIDIYNTGRDAYVLPALRDMSHSNQKTAALLFDRNGPLRNPSAYTLLPVIPLFTINISMLLRSLIHHLINHRKKVSLGITIKKNTD